MWVLNPPAGENSFFRETLGESVENRCFRGFRQCYVARARGKGSGANRGCCRGATWVSNRVGGYPGKTPFLERPWEQDSGGGSSSDYG